MASLVSNLETFFKETTVIKIKGRPLTFNSAAGLQSATEQKTLGEIFKQIIEECNKIVNPEQGTKESNKTTPNPNSRLRFGETVDDNEDGFDKIAEYIFRYTFPGNKGTLSYWFIYGIIHQTLIGQNVNLSIITSQKFYTISMIESLYERMVAGDKSRQLIKKISDKLCETSDKLDSARMLKEFGDQGIRLQSAPKSQGNGNKCARYRGNELFSRRCTQEMICDSLIMRDTIDEIKSKNLKTILEKMHEAFRIYYGYLGNQCEFTLQKINAQIEKLIERGNYNKEPVPIASIQLPQELAYLSEQQQKILYPELYKGGNESSGGGPKYLNKAFKKMDKMTKRELRILVKKVGKRNTMNFLNRHKDEKIVKKLIKRVENL